MASSGTCGVDKSGSATDECTVTNRSDDNESLTTLDGRRCINRVPLMLVDGQGLSRDGRLINLEIRVFGDDTTVGGDDGTL